MYFLWVKFKVEHKQPPSNELFRKKIKTVQPFLLKWTLLFAVVLVGGELFQTHFKAYLHLHVKRFLLNIYAVIIST